MPMRPDQIERAQTLLKEVEKIHHAHAEVITGDLSIRTLMGDCIFTLIDGEEAHNRMTDVIARELATAFETKLNELRDLEVDVSKFKLSQLSDYR